jgi:hypothetical protein
VVFDDGGRRVALVSVDVCVLPSELVRTMQQAWVATTAMPADAVYSFEYRYKLTR